MRIRFKFDCELIEKDLLDNIFENIDSALTIRFDENLKHYSNDNENIYRFENISNLKQDNIEKTIDEFFYFNFDDTVHTELYKFLVLENNNQLTILANIHSSIFNYGFIDVFYESFKNLSFENIKFYCPDNANEHCQEDSEFWKYYLKNTENYIKFHNIKSNNYKRVKMPLINETVNSFNMSEFDFIIAIFSLYLSRIDKTDGCLFKIYIPSEEGLYKKSLLKVNYKKSYSFKEHLNDFNEMISQSKLHTDENVPDMQTFYSIYDFRNLNENVNIYNGNGDALTLNMHEKTLELVYNADLFHDMFINNMLSNIEAMINNVLNSPNQLCKDIDILSKEEKTLIMEFSKGKHMPFDKTKTFSKAFCEHAKNTPDKLAIDDGVNQVSYGELEKSSSSIASELQNKYGIGLNTFVGLMLPRNYHYPELVLALNKIRSTFIPIDVNYPIKRIEHMIDISQAEYIITTKDYTLDRNLDIPIIYIEDLNPFLDTDFELTGTGDDIFSIMFTSGTTGLPKGVEISNKQVGGTAIAIKNIFDSSDCNLTGCYPSFSFVGSHRMFWALYNGGTCRIFNEDEQKDKFKLIEIIRKEHFHDIMIPASIGLALLENENLKLDYLITGASKLNNMPQNKSDTKIINLYGSTEIFSVANICDFENNDFSIGKPMSNTWVYILDENSMQLPIGVPGEICVSNDYLSQGYYKNPEVTNKVFVDNPYCDCNENERMYRTGDIGFYNFDGKLEIIGREDNQLSVKGFRIESGEIFGISDNFDSLTDVFLDVDNDMLIFYYVALDDFDIDELKNALMRELPYYMIPSLFIKLDEIPLNPNGKVDKSKLPKELSSTRNIKSQNKTEQELLEMCWDILKNRNFGVCDNLTNLGMSSLHFMNLNYKIYLKYNINLNYLDLIECGNVRGIHNILTEENDGIFKKYEKRDIYPLTENQIFTCRERVKNPLNFKMYFTVKITDVDVFKLKNSFIEFMDMHPFLKSTLIEHDGNYYLKREDDTDISNLIKVYMKNKTEFEVFEKQLLAYDFNLDEIYLSEGFTTYNDKFFYCLMVENDNDVFVSILFDHLFFDYYSLFLMYNEIDKIYSDHKDEIEEEVIDGFDYNMFSVDFEKDNSTLFDEFERDILNYGSLDIPPVKKCGEECCQRDNLMHIFDDKESIQKICHDNKIRYNQFFMATLALAMHKYSGLKKGILSTVSNGRFFNEIKNTQHYFAKTIYLKFEMDEWNCLNDVFTNINDEMKRIIETEPNTFKSFFTNQWLFNFLEVEEYDFNLDITDFNLKTNRLRLIKNIGENLLNDIMLFETKKEFVVYLVYLNKYYTEEFITEFVEYWNDIIQYITSKGTLNINLDFLEKI